MMGDHRDWIKFVFEDFCGDENLQSCSLETQGFYIHLMKVLNRSKTPGFLPGEGAENSVQTLSKLLPNSKQTIRKHLRILQVSGVLKQDESGQWYSLRMYQDWLEYEKNRDNGKKGGNPQLVKGGLTHPLKQNKNKNKNKNKIYTPNPLYDDEFTEWWDVYPRKIGKLKTRELYDQLRDENVPAAMLLNAAEAYADEKAGDEPRFILHPSTFLGPQRLWEDYAAMKGWKK